MKEQVLGVDVIINDIQSNPCCTHGPTILFERFQGNGVSKRYYACSACRDRKDCSFYHPVEQKFSEAKKEVWEGMMKEAASKWKHKSVYALAENVKNLPGLQRRCCVTCGVLMGLNNKSHKKCTIKTPILDSNLLRPSLFLPPKDNVKLEAQYMFSESSVEVIMGMLGQLGAEKILCLGTPRLYEEVLNSPEKKMSSLLMDIDERYGTFFSPSQYVRYNMFNHHFFDGEEAKQTYKQFITGNEKMVLVCDPPFGGRMELLAHNILAIQNEWRAANELGDDHQLSVLFIFPYFMEPQVLQQLPNFVMLDYQVDYDNHPLYSSGPKGMINGSAVRVFVNDRPSLFVMPENKGYRFCSVCDRWVRSSNVHCEKCNGCMSKDGRTYKHCDDCQKCVKPSWKHCSDCNKCQQQDHKCGEAESTARSIVCHLCRKEGHKRFDCPDRKRSHSASKDDVRAKKMKVDANGNNSVSFGKKNKKNKKGKNPQTTSQGSQLATSVGNKNHTTSVNGNKSKNGSVSKKEVNGSSPGSHSHHKKKKNRTK